MRTRKQIRARIDAIRKAALYADPNVSFDTKDLPLDVIKQDVVVGAYSVDRENPKAPREGAFAVAWRIGDKSSTPGEQARPTPDEAHFLVECFLMAASKFAAEYVSPDEAPS